jgi:hypothetical protein
MGVGTAHPTICRQPMYEIEYTPQAVGDLATIASSALMLEKQPASIKLCTKYYRGGLHERR